MLRPSMEDLSMLRGDDEPSHIVVSWQDHGMLCRRAQGASFQSPAHAEDPTSIQSWSQRHERTGDGQRLAMG